MTEYLTYSVYYIVIYMILSPILSNKNLSLGNVRILVIIFVRYRTARCRRPLRRGACRLLCVFKAPLRKGSCQSVKDWLRGRKRICYIKLSKGAPNQCVIGFSARVLHILNISVTIVGEVLAASRRRERSFLCSKSLVRWTKSELHRENNTLYGKNVPVPRATARVAPTNSTDTIAIQIRSGTERFFHAILSARPKLSIFNFQFSIFNRSSRFP